MDKAFLPWNEKLTDHTLLHNTLDRSINQWPKGVEAEKNSNYEPIMVI
jgi:hypothetical protein